MAERTPQDYLMKVLELSREMVSLGSIDPGYELDVGCRTVFGTLFDYGYALKKLTEKELAAHAAAGQSLAGGSSPVAGISSPADRKTVLIADEDPDFLSYLSLLFQENGFETLTARSSREAMELSGARRPDLLILDASMLGRSGASVHRDLREDPELGEIPAILLGAGGKPPAPFGEPSPRASEAAQFVAKPLDLDLLWEAVRRALADAEVRRSPGS